ncbi:sugar phosphate nucleotidyltransferase [Cohnella hashimotonis]|uniref:Sugar phosphate nucleotidyltransferase n=1 Tax=Cohnella hashimotonis TaxID=2826895 RepID=A0ABT6TCW4_9BACL|nr:sugar phosphate nucleotidyltransferase [Cohnella hashimotonis]MDI4644170.1 sugar phosphate nucleotidyltransferase [Cohnella hashimotonis]
MKLVLLSGGSGKRLWPLSNETRSKQFLKVLEREDGTMESMVQRVWRQLGASGLARDAYIATGSNQAEMIRSQLGEVPMVLEPNRRDTFPAIALAAVYLYAIEGVSLQETVAVLPVDPYVEDRFFDRVAELDRVLRTSGAPLALMGVKPLHPSEKYGYIVPKPASGVTSSDWQLVGRFTEKPSEAEAKRLIGEGALWNCGVFAFRLGMLIDLLIEKQLPINYEELVRSYERMPKISFDYEVVEQAGTIAVSEYDGYWKDLGTWNTLTEEIKTGVIGNGTKCDESTGSHIVNELGLPIVLLGLQNVIVSASPDGILVADKQKSPKVKEIVGSRDDEPMFEERVWGSYRVLDCSVSGADKVTKVGLIQMHAGKQLPYHAHLFRSETWTVASGEGELLLDGIWRKMKAGDVVHIPAAAKHGMLALTDLSLVEVQIGTDLSVDDVREAAWDGKDRASIGGGE